MPKVIRHDPKPVAPSFTVELTQTEAIILYDLVGRVGGPDSGPRFVTDALYYAFKDADVPNITQETRDTASDTCVFYGNKVKVTK